MELPTPYRYAEVLLPRPLAYGFTYEIPEELRHSVRPGSRVVVSFGKRKLYSGIVVKLHNTAPENHLPKPIVEDLGPVVDDMRVIRFWEWMARYYMCTPGEVMNVALPSRFKLESETRLNCLPDPDHWPDNLSEQETEILLYTRSNPDCTIQDVVKHIGTSAVRAVRRLVDSGHLIIKEKVRHQSLEKWIKVVHLQSDKEEEITQILNFTKKSPTQQNLILAYYKLHSSTDYITVERLLHEAKAGVSSLESLVRKGIFQISEVKESSLPGRAGKAGFDLTPAQKVAFDQIISSFVTGKTVLLHGVTSSGKTEIYVHLLKEAEKAGGQCLMLVPEIALTTQLIGRLRQFFGDRISLYHSRMTDKERSDVWESVRKQEPGGRLIVGARSALFLPYCDLRLTIIDEEHDASYRQDAPNPRYQGRDAAIYLATLYNARVLLGSATPSVESYFNAISGKYTLVELHERYEGLSLPEVKLINLISEKKQNRLRGNFSQTMLDAMESALSRGKQSIVFINRRGYSPRIVCQDCGYIYICDHCDIALTFHKAVHKLKCHYCGREKPVPTACMVCGSVHLELLGAGTEQVEDELYAYFPSARIGRLDLDTARSKKKYAQLLTDMESGNVDILVGTQMVTKGLNFSKVEVVGVVNADALLYFPEYRAHERAYQILEQVAGRSGRSGEQGKVYIQAYNITHPILSFVTAHDYKAFYSWQTEERKQFLYPPFVKMIQLTLRHMDLKTVQLAATHLANKLKDIRDIAVIGPEFPPVARVNSYYRMRFLIKIARNQSYLKVKNHLWDTCLTFFSQADYRKIRYQFEVDA